MQIDLPTMIALGTVFCTVVGSWIRNETNQKHIIEHLKRLNGNVAKNADDIFDHIKTCHMEKK